jgi:hypothetical protein
MERSTTCARLILEVDETEGPVRGTIANVRGERHEYVGWIALIKAVEELRGAKGEDG